MSDHDNTFPSKESDNKLSELYRQTQNSDIDTPDLDRSILAAARKELAQGKPGEVIRPSRWYRWSPPLAAAAGVLLAVSIVLNIILFQQADLVGAVEKTPQSAVEMLEQPVPAFEPLAAPATFSQETDTSSLNAERSAPKTNGDINRIGKPKASPRELEEVIVTGSRLINTPTELQKQDVDEKVRKIIELLENGKIAEGKQLLDELLKSQPNK